MESKLDWEFIKAQLPPEWRELAIERGLIRSQPPQLHAKVTDIEQVLRLLLHRVSHRTSLLTTTATAVMAKQAIRRAQGEQAADKAQLVELSAPALHYWERKMAPYLAELLARMLATDELFPPAQWSGYDLVLADGTTVTRPGAKGTTARVLYALRLCDLTVVSCQVTDEHGSESFRVFEPRPGQLWIADRFYSNPFDIAWVNDAGAATLVRYNLGALRLHDSFGRPFDVLDHVRLYRKAGERAEWSVQVLLKDHTPIEGRLCALRLSEEQAEKARERLRREYGADVSAESLQAAAWLLVFTTAPADRMTTRQVLELYRLRWQIELELKRDKSLGGMDELPNFRTDTIATWLYTQLLLQQIARKIVSPRSLFPPALSEATSCPALHESPTPSPAAPALPTAQQTNGPAPSESPTPSPAAPPSPSAQGTMWFAPNETRKKLCAMLPRIVSEMWRVMTLVYQTLRTAFLPIVLHQVPQLLDAFLAHLARRNETKRPKQIELFLQQVQPRPSAAPDSSPPSSGERARASPVLPGAVAAPPSSGERARASPVLA